MPEFSQIRLVTKVAKPKVRTTPTLKVLPPTAEAFEQNEWRTHIQTVIWKSAAKSNQPAMQLWIQRRSDGKATSYRLVPRMMPPHTAISLYHVWIAAIAWSRTSLESRYQFGGNLYYVTMQITFLMRKFRNGERNLQCDVVTPNGCLASISIAMTFSR